MKQRKKIIKLLKKNVNNQEVIIRLLSRIELDTTAMRSDISDTAFNLRSIKDYGVKTKDA